MNLYMCVCVCVCLCVCVCVTTVCAPGSCARAVLWCEEEVAVAVSLRGLNIVNISSS